MRLRNSHYLITLAGSPKLQIIILVFLVVFVSNLNAIVDAALHPDIPYFDEEHLVVGGITGLVSLVIFGLLLIYVRTVDKALKQISTLEKILPICAHCKRIRKPGANPYDMDSWETIESYITENTSAELTHGICPQCRELFSPELKDEGKG